MDTNKEHTPPSREIQIEGSEKFYEHLQAFNTVLEALIAKLGVPKTVMTQ